MGFPIDFNSNATEMPVYSMPSGINGAVEMQTKKIYPNVMDQGYQTVQYDKDYIYSFE